MRINFPALFAFKIESRHTTCFPTGIVAKHIREINNGTFGKATSPLDPGKEKAVDVPNRSKGPLFVRNTAKSPARHSTSTPEGSPRFINRQGQTNHRAAAMQPLRAGYGGAPPPHRRERHLLGLPTSPPSTPNVPSPNRADPLKAMDVAYFSVDNGADPGSVGNGWATVDPHSQDYSDVESNYGSDSSIESEWDSDCDSVGSDDCSSEDEWEFEGFPTGSLAFANDSSAEPALHSPEYFERIENGLLYAMQYFRDRASQGALTSSVPQFGSASDSGCGSEAESPGYEVEGQRGPSDSIRSTSTEQRSAVVRRVRSEFVFHKEAIEAFDMLPDDVKQTDGSAPLPGMDQGPEYRSVTTFADMIKHGRETLKKRTGSIQPPPQSTAKPDILSEIQNFNRTTLKPVDSSVPQTKQAGIARVDDVPRTVSTHDALLRVMREMSPPDQD